MFQGIICTNWVTITKSPREKKYVSEKWERHDSKNFGSVLGSVRGTLSLMCSVQGLVLGTERNEINMFSLIPYMTTSVKVIICLQYFEGDAFQPYSTIELKKVDYEY